MALQKQAIEAKNTADDWLAVEPWLLGLLNAPCARSGQHVGYRPQVGANRFRHNDESCNVHGQFISLLSFTYIQVDEVDRSIVRNA